MIHHSVCVDYDGRIYRQVSHDEECRALAHATKRCTMASGSYDNNDKLGLTGQHDDGLSLKLQLIQTGAWASGDRPQKLCRQYGVCQIHS